MFTSSMFWWYRDLSVGGRNKGERSVLESLARDVLKPSLVKA